MILPVRSRRVAESGLLPLSHPVIDRAVMTNVKIANIGITEKIFLAFMIIFLYNFFLPVSVSLKRAPYKPIGSAKITISSPPTEKIIAAPLSMFDESA